MNNTKLWLKKTLNRRRALMLRQQFLLFLVNQKMKLCYPKFHFVLNKSLISLQLNFEKNNELCTTFV
jgi:hypothetical protein